MTELDIYKMEHLCIADLVLSDCVELSAEWKDSLLGYINGVNTMASMMVDSMKQEKSHE